MKKQLLTVMLFLLFVASQVHAQNRVITGKVTGKDDGLPLPGVSVVVKGSKTGTQTSGDGNYSITVTGPKPVLVFSYISYKTTEVPVTGGTLNVALEAGNKELTEVVVTAFGVKREKKALGYAVSTVDSKDLALRPESDIGRILSGKAPGLNILATSGLSGSGTNISIRGVNTITGNSDPLFIVDGVPFDGSTNAQTDFRYGTQTSSRFLDIDPNNIESINVLKGLSATTLYGELGKNGVIVITTKNGSTQMVKPKTEISLSQSYFATKAVLPVYNDVYGGGFDLSQGITFYSNWGAKFTDPPAVLKHPYDRAALTAAFPQFVGAPYLNEFHNSVANFFKTGASTTTALNIAGSAANLNYNLSYSYNDDQGYLEGNGLYKNTFGMGGTAKLSNKFTASGSVNYVTNDVKSPPTSNSYGNNAVNTSVFGNVLYTPTAVDLMGLPYENPLDHSSVYYRQGNDIQNPRWTLYNSFTQDKVSRIFGQLSLKYDILKSLFLMYKGGYDSYTEFQEYAQNKGGISTPTGILRTSTGISSIYDHTVSLNYDKQLTTDFNLNAIAGANSRRTTYDQTGLTSTTQLVYGLINHANFVDHRTTSESGTNLDYSTDQLSLGLFAQGQLGYKEYAYLTLGARNTWSSKIETANRSTFYPGTSISFIPTSAFESLKSNKYVNYLKFRVGYSTSANFPPAYSTRSALAIGTKSFVTAGGTSVNYNALSTRASNADLKAEILKEIETGIEGKFFDSRLSLDFTLYRRTSSNQILESPLDPSTGYSSQYINAGQVVNRGIEIAAGYTVIKSKSLKWQLDGLFSLNRSMVSDIPAYLGIINIAGYTNEGTIATNGSPLGVLYGSYIQRDPKTGARLVSATGDYVTASDYKVIGDPTPKWKTTGISTISYKGLSFRAQVDYTYGGDMFSSTVGALLGRGVTADTEFDRAKPLILPGELASTLQPNNIEISATQAYFNNNSPGGAPDEASVYDATVVRLREISLSYSLPAKWLTKTPLGSVSFQLSGTNLWYYAPNFPKYTNFDPESSGLGVSSGRGFEFLSGPSARRFGGSIRVTF